MQRQNTVAEVIDQAIQQLDPRAVQGGQDILVRQQQGGFVLQRVLPDGLQIQLPAQAAQLHQDYAGVDVGNLFLNPQPPLVGVGQQLAGMGAGHKQVPLKVGAVQRHQGIDDNDISIQVQDAV